ncbi:hypothetical protein JV173_00515 [Acholeplasma equirhinis]|uniref:hypothetical protein n=1 Tax=Acholeplasma equirhinis TaxID=555393 RepID=UPI00197A9FC6|nr:hypothetical protein [Acholeplasma equirhinis]MBN3489986.1 hypothetical protein [Acholeplasma equirhinis]
MDSKYTDNTGPSIPESQIGLKLDIHEYKRKIFKTISHDLKFIKINRYIFLYLFTGILITLLIIAVLIITGNIPIGEDIDIGHIYTFLSGIFVQMIALMLIVFKYLFDPT